MSTLDLLVRRLTDSGFGSERLPYRARNSNTALGIADNGGWFDLTGTFTQTFQAVGSIGPDTSFVLRNAGTGDITLDPNGSETIDGLASFIMYPGEARLIQCDGTALRSIVLQAFSKTFTESGNFIKAPGYPEFSGVLRSGGAGGVFVTNTGSRADGGPGGGAFPFTIAATALATSTLVTIGAGGAASTVSGGNPTPGGDSSFAGMIVKGASISQGGSVNGTSATNGSDFGPSLPNIPNSIALFGGGSVDTASSGKQGSSYHGGGCGGLLSSSNSVGPNGTSLFAGNGGAANPSGPGANGVAPSGGGGASRVSPSGAGARGQLDIWGVV